MGKVQKNETSKPATEYSSKKLIKKTPYRIATFFDNDDTHIAVIAEDKDGLYITREDLISSCILDPYKCYHRHKLEVIENSTGEYTIKKNDIVYSI